MSEEVSGEKTAFPDLENVLELTFDLTDPTYNSSPGCRTALMVCATAESSKGSPAPVPVPY